MIYLTKDNTGLVQLWNNKPELANGIWVAWINKKSGKNEIGIDITNNNYFKNLFSRYKTPYCVVIKDIHIESLNIYDK